MDYLIFNITLGALYTISAIIVLKYHTIPLHKSLDDMPVEPVSIFYTVFPLANTLFAIHIVIQLLKKMER